MKIRPISVKGWRLMWIHALGPPPPPHHSLIWPIPVCAAEQGMVFMVLSLKQGI